MIKNFDVIIIGCGPAGIAAAKTLIDNNSNINFCMIDKEDFPRKKLCAGGLTHKSINILKELDINFDNNIKRKFDVLDIYLSGKKWSINLDKPVVMVDRIEFDNNNLNQIKKYCTNIFLKENIINIDDNVLITDKCKYKFKYLIFADGVNGYSRKFSGLKKIGYCVEINVKNKENYNMIASFDAINYGYGWIFPKGDTITIGLGKFMHVKDDYKKKLENFCEYYNIDIGNKKIYGFPIPTGNYIKKPVLNNIIIIGDAAGLVNPITGEGISYALASGRNAALSIIEKHCHNKINLSKIYHQKMRKIYIDLKYKKFNSLILYSSFKTFIIKIGFSNSLFKWIGKKIAF